ncbi:MAG: ArsR family transcriptional regulator [Trueperaceae bacterium]|nr:ArsR family transcriptional regulator [Trueperaceae bacterium]
MNKVRRAGQILHQLGGQHQDRTIELDIWAELPDTLSKLKALASEPRLRIIEYLAHHLCNLTEIAEALNMNLATVTMHINILEEAGLIICEHKPGDRGTQRVCGCLFDRLNVHVVRKREPDVGNLLEFPIRIGSYTDFQVAPTCGIVSSTGLIGLLDDPASFYEAERINAELLWFHCGYVEYRLPNRLPSSAKLESLSLSMEVCSEAPMHHLDWPSDITVWINGVELGSWTSPSDFGGIRGKLTPSWQWESDTQYGLLKVWQVSQVGSLVDGLRVSDVSLSDLAIHNNSFISVRIGVKEDATHVGGVNIFGAKFGNYPQDIVLRIRYF